MFTSMRDFLADDTGSASVESAVIVVVMAALAGILYKVVTGESVLTGLEGLIDKAFSITP